MDFYDIFHISKSQLMVTKPELGELTKSANAFTLVMNHQIMRQNHFMFSKAIHNCQPIFLELGEHFPSINTPLLQFSLTSVETGRIHEGFTLQNVTKIYRQNLQTNELRWINFSLTAKMGDIFLP